MQTFLPFSNFEKSASVLDNKRLGKQRVECKQIWRALRLGGGWAKHPVVRMWRGHLFHLLTYYKAICDEWKDRGFKHEMTIESGWLHDEQYKGPPPWLGIETFHSTHRAVLVRKDEAYYAPRFDGLRAWYPSYVDSSLLWPIDKEGRLTLNFAVYTTDQPF